MVLASRGAGDEWWDLCAGPHVESTGALPKKAIELESVAGAYWRGDEKRPMLQRIYGTAWETPEQLQLFRQQQEEAKRRDHRTLGQQLDLFSIQVCHPPVPGAPWCSSAVGGGCWLGQPHHCGTRIRNHNSIHSRGQTPMSSSCRMT